MVVGGEDYRGGENGMRGDYGGCWEFRDGDNVLGDENDGGAENNGGDDNP